MSSIDGAVSRVLTAQDTALKSDIAMAIQVKSLDAAKQQGEAVIKLLDQAVQLSKSIGSGGNFDAIA